MQSLAQINPRGRLDVLVYRLAERLAERLCPAEWPVFAPHVEQWARNNFGPKRPRRRKATK